MGEGILIIIDDLQKIIEKETLKLLDKPSKITAVDIENFSWGLADQIKEQIEMVN